MDIEQEAKFYMEIDGERIEIADIFNIQTLRPDIQWDKEDMMLTYPPEISITIRAPKTNRKRMIKLLMARGIQRNGAKELAKWICDRFGYYDPMVLLLYF